MELSGRYDLRLSDKTQAFIYGGPSGDAALGPTGFPHRASASENPVAVIGHHQEDSTHIATNVMTLGFSGGPLQLEASTFHGREPDENRWNFNTGKPDLFAARLTLAPHKNLSAQFSSGRINNPEALDPKLDTVRTTASLHYNVAFSGGHIASSLIWGRNKDLKNGERRIFNSYNSEVTVKFLNRNWLWTRSRAPTVTARFCRLPLQCNRARHACFAALWDSPVSPLIQSHHIILSPDGKPVTAEEIPIGRVQAYTVGYEREVPSGFSWLNAGLGMQATLYELPAQLKPSYGNLPAGVVMFLRLRPAGNLTEHMRQMHGR